MDPTGIRQINKNKRLIDKMVQIKAKHEPEMLVGRVTTITNYVITILTPIETSIDTFEIVYIKVLEGI